MIPAHTAELLQITTARQHIDDALRITAAISSHSTQAQQQRLDVALRGMSRVRVTLHNAEQAAQQQECAA